MLTTLIGLLLPPVIDVINRYISDSMARFWVAVAFCVLIGSFIATLDTNGFIGMSLRESADAIAGMSIQVFGWAQLSYKGAWEHSSVRSTLRLKAQ